MTTAHAPRARPRRALSRRPLALLAAVAAAFAALLCAAPPAAAHATLTGSTPGEGEVVATAPEHVTLTFSEDVGLGDDAIRVLDPDGERADTGELSEAGERGHAVALRGDGLRDGTYTVAWQVVSADSHPISGAFTFSIGAPSATSVHLPDGEAGGGTTGLLYDVARYAAYAGFVLLGGAVAFVLICRPEAAGSPAAQRVTLAGWVTLTAGTLALLLLRTPYTGSGRLADALDLAGLRDVVETRTGTALVTRLLLVAAAGLLVAVLHGPYARVRGASGSEADERVRDLTFGLALGGAVLGVAMASTWALSEHAATGRQTWLAVPADVLHLLAVAAWLGGLATLLALLRHEPERLTRAAVRRFSALALASVTALLITGLYQSWRQVGWSLTALTTTSYGRLLLLKTALVATLLAAAWASRRWTSRLTDPPREPLAAAGGAAAAAGGAGPAPRVSGPERVPAEAGNDASPGAPGTAGHGPTGAKPRRTEPTEARSAGPVGASPGDPGTTGREPAGEELTEARPGALPAGPTGVSSEDPGTTGPPPTGAEPGGARPRSAADASAGDASTPTETEGSGAASVAEARASLADAGAAGREPAGAEPSPPGPHRNQPTAPEAGGAKPAGAAGGPAEGGGRGGAGPDGVGRAGRGGQAGVPVDARRARQLARQRVAVEAARRRKVREGDAGRAGLRRAVFVETAVAAVLLAVATALSGATPARTQAALDRAAEPAAATVPFDTGGANGRGSARLDLDPGRPGDNTLHIRLTDPDGRPLDVAELRVALALPAEDLGPLRFEPAGVEPGHWAVTSLRLPRPGDWELSLTIRTSDIDQVTETATLPVD
uniref:copper resistance CopC/CopD family protein n=1 Tax=Streptomyces boetiae TaxID=3075541 RepID=UPI00374DFFF3